MSSETGPFFAEFWKQILLCDEGEKQGYMFPAFRVLCAQTFPKPEDSLTEAVFENDPHVTQFSLLCSGLTLHPPSALTPPLSPLLSSFLSSKQTITLKKRPNQGPGV